MHQMMIYRRSILHFTRLYLGTLDFLFGKEGLVECNIQVLYTYCGEKLISTSFLLDLQFFFLM